MIAAAAADKRERYHRCTLDANLILDLFVAQNSVE